jgi:hypothetical protein
MFMSLLAGDSLTTNSVLLRNNLQHSGVPPPPTPPPEVTVSQEPQTRTGLSACELSLDWSASKLLYNQRPIGQSVLVSSTNLGPKTRFLLLSDGCWFVDVGRPLCQEDRSVVYNCCRPSPAQSFSCLNSAGPYFTVSGLRLPQSRGPGSHIHMPQEHGGPVIP